MNWPKYCTKPQTAKNINTPKKLCGSTMLKAIVPVIKKKAIYKTKIPQPTSPSSCISITSNLLKTAKLLFLSVLCLHNTPKER